MTRLRLHPAIRPLSLIALCAGAIGVSCARAPLERRLRDFVLVCSLPEPGDPLRAVLEGYLASEEAIAKYKSVRAAASYAMRDGGDDVMLVGTPGSNPHVASELERLGVEIRSSSATIGGRTYSMDDYEFEALYREGGREIALICGPAFASFVNVENSIERDGTYSLRNRARLVVEAGTVGKAGAAPRLAARITNPANAFPSADFAAAIRGDGTAWTLPSRADDYGFIDKVAAGKRILFLGEAPHYIAENHEAEAGIALRCASALGYRAVGTELLYSLWPLLEARSMGALGPATAAPYGDFAMSANSYPPGVFDAVAAFNAERAAGDKLLLTALDIDHAINHTKPLSEAYFGYLASLCASATARSPIDAARAGLSGARTLKQVDAYLDRLGKAFAAGRACFAPRDYEEIEFTLALERASIRYQLAGKSRSATGDPKVEEIRGRYFRKTIERAYAKAQARGGGLVCVVGGAHATLNGFAPGDYVTGIVSEARYFAEDYAPTAGRAASVLIVKLGAGGAYQNDPLSVAAASAMGSSPRVYLNLRELKLDERFRSMTYFFSDEGPKADGVLFVR